MFGSGSQELCVSVGELQVPQLPPALQTGREQLPESPRSHVPDNANPDALDVSPDVRWFCVDPPESGLQERVCRVRPRGVNVSDARQEALFLILIPEDGTKK